MKLISWNINGIRAVLKKGAEDYFKSEDADIVCLQETKVNEATQPEVLDDLYPFQKWNYAEKKGYSGTAILSKTAPLSITTGLGEYTEDNEGRVVTFEYEAYFLVTVYTPNSQSGLARLPYRIDTWDRAFQSYVEALDQKKPVIFCGDLNVAHEEIDLKNPKTNRKNAGFTDDERNSLSSILDSGFTDTFRAQHPGEPDHYSWWSYRAGARAKNVGWRIDYFCVSDRFTPKIADAFIRPEILGSDHCPVGISIK
ncbi:MAG: exodeoxyribonuclease III [Opitutales bacterium]